MTIQPGDPNGIAEHNALAARVGQVAALQGVTVDLPPVAVLGQSGHVDAHNKLRAAIEKVANEGGIVWAAASGGVESTITEDGKQWKVHVFNANGTLTVSQAGTVEVMLCGAGSASPEFAGNGAGGRVLRGLFTLPAGAQAVSIGQRRVGNANFNGGPTSVGPLNTGLQSAVYRPEYATGAGGTLASPQLGVASALTGTTVEYAAGTGTGPGAQDTNGIAIVRYQIV